MTLEKAPGPNERRGTEDFEINEHQGAHSGKYGTPNFISHINGLQIMAVPMTSTWVADAYDVSSSYLELKQIVDPSAEKKHADQKCP